MLIFIDGKKVGAEHLSLLAQNSAFLWGQSVFTTAKIVDGEMPFYKAHELRLQESSQWMFGENFLKSGLRPFFKEAARELEKAQWRCRITCFQDLEGKAHVMISASELKGDASDIKLKLCAHPGVVKRKSSIKVGSYADTFRLAKDLGDETPLFYDPLDGQERVLESSVSNIIFVDEEGKLSTPKESEHFLKGIGLRNGLSDLDIEEVDISKDIVPHFCGAFLINSLRGPMSVVSLEGRLFKNDPVLVAHLNESFASQEERTKEKLW